jgi:hypothetical protein
VVFSNSNGLSFGVNGSTVTGSYTVPSTAGLLSNINVSAGTTSNLMSAVTFSNSNNVSFGLNGSTVTATATVASTQGSINVSAGTTSNLASAFTLSNSNQISFGLNASTITATFAAIKSISAGTTRATNGEVILSNSNGVTFGMDAGTITASVAAGPSAGIGAISAGTTQATSGTVIFSNSNGVSFGLNGQTVTASVEAAGTLSGWPLMIPSMTSSSAYTGSTTTTAGGSRTAFSLYVSPFYINKALSFNTVGFLMTYATVAGTGSFTNAHMFGLYTLNANTAFSLVSTFHFEVRVSQNSVTARSHYWFWGTNSTSNSSSQGGNISASMAKLNHVVAHSTATSLQSGNYWLAYMQTMSTAAAAMGTFSAYHVSASASTLGSLFGTNVSVEPMIGHGIVSSTVSSNAAHVHIMPSSIHTSAFTGTGGSSQNRQNVVFVGTR